MCFFLSICKEFSDVFFIKILKQNINIMYCIYSILWCLYEFLSVVVEELVYIFKIQIIVFFYFCQFLFKDFKFILEVINFFSQSFSKRLNFIY